VGGLVQRLLGDRVVVVAVDVQALQAGNRHRRPYLVLGEVPLAVHEALAGSAGDVEEAVAGDPVLLQLRHQLPQPGVVVVVGRELVVDRRDRLVGDLGPARQLFPLVPGHD
jgi:hypothetical protein